MENKENKNIISELATYYMNPDKYPNKNKDNIEREIKNINKGLLTNKETNCDLLQQIFGYYTSDDSTAPINSIIYKTRADEKGIAATREYKEIYFNEIIQNANDNTTGNKLEINVSKSDNQYELSFTYKDDGFNIENIIGFLNTEIHTKRDKLSATGKHGVGIKSLFYFVDYMKIESNVIIEFKISTVVEGGTEKISTASTYISKNGNWNYDDKKTVFTISFPEKENYEVYNVGKLKSFIDTCEKKPFETKDIENFFFSDSQENLIFDARGLLFTDKNKGKNSGIKKMIFKNSDNKELFSISCEEKAAYLEEKNRCCLAGVKLNDEMKFECLLFTLEGDENKQNFSTAMPLNISVGSKRYYETYYLPQANEWNLNILINSEYSNVSRTKLTDDDTKKDGIKADIDKKLLEIYRFMVSEKINNSELRTSISIAFHSMLNISENFIKICLENDLNNMYLQKYINETEENKKQFFIYKRDEKEAYEKTLIGQTISKGDISGFMDEYIFKDDSAKFDENNFIDKAKEIYKITFDNNNTDLKEILNIAGTIKELIFYRITDGFYKNNECSLTDEQVDNWNKKIYDKIKSADKVNESLTIIGRYKLHSGISVTGEIKDASFYEYLFNNPGNSNGNSDMPYRTFEAVGKKTFDNDYKELKSILLQENNVITGKAYWSTRYNAYNTYYYSMNYHERSLENTDDFKNINLLINTILTQEEIKKNIICFQNMLVISNLNGRSHLTCDDNSQCYKVNKTYRKEKKLIFININFLRIMYAHSWEDFCYYIEFFRKIPKIDEFGKFEIYTKKDEKSLFSIDKNYLVDVFKFFYEDNRFNMYSNKKNRFNFDIELIGEINNNLCPPDCFNYIRNQLDVKVYLFQTNKVNNKNEIMYCYNNEVKILNENLFKEFGLTKNSNNKEIIIVCNDRLDYKESIKKVLGNEFKANTFIEKFEAFIPENQSYAIYGEEYDNITGKYCELNTRNKKIRGVYADLFKDYRANILKSIITARGNNDGICCCCGKKMNTDDMQLIITTNINYKTKNEYPQVVEVVCKKCREIIKKSHMNTKVINENEEFYVEYKCKIQNSHQSKKVVFKHRLCNGLLKLYYVKK